jgi:hypothetical protein
MIYAHVYLHEPEIRLATTEWRARNKQTAHIYFFYFRLADGEAKKKKRYVGMLNYFFPAKIGKRSISIETNFLYTRIDDIIIRAVDRVSCAYLLIKIKTVLEVESCFNMSDFVVRRISCTLRSSVFTTNAHTFRWWLGYTHYAAVRVCVENSTAVMPSCAITCVRLVDYVFKYNRL